MDEFHLLLRDPETAKYTVEVYKRFRKWGGIQIITDAFYNIVAQETTSDEEKDKLTKIYEQYYGTMLDVAKSIISDHALAEDAVSEAIMAIIKNLHKIDDILSHKTRAYIVIIVRSRSINLLNKHKNHPEESIDDMELPDNSTPTLDELEFRTLHKAHIFNEKLTFWCAKWT